MIRIRKINKKRDLQKYVCGLLLFGSNGYVASHIALSSHEIVLLRSILGTILLAALFFAGGRSASIYLRSKKDSLFVILSGAAMAADWLLLFEAYQQIGVSLSILINYCGPFIVIALSPLILKEKLRMRKIAAMAAAFIGVILVSGSAAVSGINPRGLLCAILSAFAYALMVLANKKSKTITGMENSMLQLLTTTIVVVLFSLMTRRIPAAIDRGSLFPILWLGLINTGLGCYLYFSSINGISAQSVGILGYLEPLSGVLLSAALLGERMSPLQILGAALILLGALFSELCFKRKNKNPEIFHSF